MGEKFPPSITAAKLYERTSAKGNQYLTGRLGGLRIAILKTADVDEQGNAIWQMRFSEAKPAGESAKGRRAAQPDEQQRGSDSDDDKIPF